MSKGRKLKAWEAMKFMEEETAGFIVTADRCFTWQDLRAVFAEGEILTVRPWYEYREPPKPMTLADRFVEKWNTGTHTYMWQYKEWLEAQPESKPRIDLAEAFAKKFNHDLIGREVILSWLKGMK